MTARKVFKTTVMLMAGLVLLLVVGVNIIGIRADVVDGVTGAKIKEVKPGMSLEKVISTLGQPYKVEAGRGIHVIGCKNPRPSLSEDLDSTTDIRAVVDSFYLYPYYCCEGNREDMQEKKVTLLYSRPVKFAKNYPMLWVHLGEEYKVTQVYAKRYSGLPLLEDQGIYNLSWGEDAATFEERQDTTVGFIQEEAFQESFK